MESTFDRVGLDELSTVYKQRLGDGIPRGYRLGKAEVYVCGGNFVHMKPDILWPRILDQLFIWVALVSWRSARKARTSYALSTLSRPM
jgi:hypothetical protein